MFVATDTRRVVLIVCIVASTLGCNGRTELPSSAGIGPRPILPAAKYGIIPTVSIAPAEEWPAGGKPHAAQGLTVERFASGLEHPRWLYGLPTGDILVAETNAPPRPQEAKSVKAWIMHLVMKRTGAATPSANRITPGETRISGPPNKRHRSSRWPDQSPLDEKRDCEPRRGKRLYVAVGSNNNAAENGIEAEAERTAIWEVDPSTGRHRLFASGLRNPVGMAWEPETGALWVAVNERDELGNDLVPDYMTAVHDGAFYGWPYSYFGQNLDERVEPQRLDLVEQAIAPDYALGAHTASLGLASSRGTTLPPLFANGMFVGQHGSWNREPRSGYKVAFVPFRSGRPSGEPIDVLTGFVSENGHAYGRPVGVILDGRGALLVADDVGNTVWRVSTANVRQADR